MQKIDAIYAKQFMKLCERELVKTMMEFMKDLCKIYERSIRKEMIYGRKNHENMHLLGGQKHPQNRQL